MVSSLVDLQTPAELPCRSRISAVAKEYGREVLVYDDAGCLRCQFAADQIKAFGGIEQQRSHVVGREETFRYEHAHQCLQDEPVELAVVEHPMAHRNLPIQFRS